MPLVRSLVSLPAGIAGMPLLPFILYTVAGSIAWNTALIGAGWVLGDQWTRVEAYVSPLSYVVLMAGATAAAWYVWRRRKRLLHRVEVE